MEDMGVDPGFWRGRRVLITGHTGFKGSWLALWLSALGANVSGFSHDVPTEPSLYRLARVGEIVESIEGDVRDYPALAEAVARVRPEVVVHMAAQSLVRRSFADPRETYETNVMGTVNLLEAVRARGEVRVVVNVTSDKCYESHASDSGYREDDPMGGHDPYSSSKGAAELVTAAYRRSFFPAEADATRLASARAGNAIGGGDWGEDRLVPDLIRAAAAGEPLLVRNPDAVRPWQHVLNPLSGYLILAQLLWEHPELAAGWNFSPDREDMRTVQWVLERIAQRWPDAPAWERDPRPQPPETQVLRLDSSRARTQLGWHPAWDLATGLDAVIEWQQGYACGVDAGDLTRTQIARYMAA
jgi:CDP-glucose 4,6-dehydratase